MTKKQRSIDKIRPTDYLSPGDIGEILRFHEWQEKQKPCITVQTARFLFWTWKYEDENHDWAYKNKEKRVCQKCGQKEILYGEYYGGEDWRKAK